MQFAEEVSDAALFNKVVVACRVLEEYVDQKSGQWSGWEKCDDILNRGRTWLWFADANKLWYPLAGLTLCEVMSLSIRI